MDVASLMQNKAVVSLGAMMALKYTGYTIPVLECRIVYGVCMVVQALLLLLLYQKIASGAEGETLVVREVDDATKGLKSTTYTNKEYDTKQMMKQIQQFATSAAITIGMHMYGKYTTPMAIACLQPIFMAADPLFQIHLLGRPAVDKLKRPFPDMATDMKIKMLEEQEKKASDDAKMAEVAGAAEVVIQDVTDSTSSDDLAPKAATGATKRRAKRT